MIATTLNQDDSKANIPGPKNRNQDFGSKKNRNQDFGTRPKIVRPRPRKEPFFLKGYFPGCFGVPGIYIHHMNIVLIFCPKSGIQHPPLVGG